MPKPKAAYVTATLLLGFKFDPPPVPKISKCQRASSSARRSGLGELQDKSVLRSQALARRARAAAPIAGVVRIPEEIGGRAQGEAGFLHFILHGALLDPMQSLC